MSDYNVFNQDLNVGLGTDLILESGPDGGTFATTTNGDFTDVAQLVNLRDAIKRRIFTPAGSIGTFVQDVNGLYNIDDTYGNTAYRYLSEPLTNETLANMRDAIVDCLKGEPRIIVHDVIPTIKSMPDGRSMIDFIAEFKVIETDSTDNLVISYDPANSRLY